MCRKRWTLLTAAAILVASLTGPNANRASGAPSQVAGSVTNGPSITTVLTTRQFTADGKKMITATVWRCSQTWQTEVARTDDGQLVRVDPLSPLGERNAQGELVRWSGNKAKTVELYPSRKVLGSPLPPERWQAPDFDDSAWMRTPAPELPIYGALALTCLRGRFVVTDPSKARDLDLTVRFRGGVVVYVNGAEIGRSGLPKGQIKPDTLAEDYPKEAYVTSNGVVFLQSHWTIGPIPVDAVTLDLLETKDPDAMARFKSRCRTFEVKVPTSALRKGVNVLAVEIHRAPAWAGMFTSRAACANYGNGGRWIAIVNKPGLGWWNRCEIEDVRLTAGGDGEGLVPNIGPSTDEAMRVWNFPAAQELSPAYYPEPGESVRPIRLVGVKNGTYSGEIVASSGRPIRGLKAEVTDLDGTTGRIPSSSVQIAYGRNGHSAGAIQAWQYDALDATPAKDATMQPVWLTVRVPAQAKAGQYAGKVTVCADGETDVVVPLQLEVIGDWAMPDAQQFTTVMGFLQCPDAVAKRYKAPLWSEEHWKLLDRTFEILGQIGTKDVYIPLVAKTHLGNEFSMVRWISSSASPQAVPGQPSYTYDFAIAERYLDLAIKHLGKVPIVCLYGATANQREGGGLYTEMNQASRELKEMKAPDWGTPESRAFWKPAVDGLREVLAKRGLQRSMMFGLLGDNALPNKAGKSLQFDDFCAISPQTKWVASTHWHPCSWNVGASGHGGAEWKGTNILGACSMMHTSVLNVNGMLGGDEAPPAEARPIYGWREKSFPTIALAAARWPYFAGGTVANWRTMAEGALMSTGSAGGAEGRPYHGLGTWGADFWNNEWGYDVAYAQTGLSYLTQYVIGAGELGPVATCRTRMLQESLQEAEARVFVQNAILDDDKRPKLGDDLLRRCDELCGQRTREFAYMTFCCQDARDRNGYRRAVIPDIALWEESSLKLYRLVDEVAKALAK